MQKLGHETFVTIWRKLPGSLGTKTENLPPPTQPALGR